MAAGTARAHARPLPLIHLLAVHGALLGNQAILAVHVFVMKWLTSPHVEGALQLFVANHTDTQSASHDILGSASLGGLGGVEQPRLPSGVEDGIKPNIVCAARCLLATPFLMLLAVRQSHKAPLKHQQPEPMLPTKLSEWLDLTLLGLTGVWASPSRCL